MHLKRSRVLFQSRAELLAVPETIEDVGFHEHCQGLDDHLQVPTREKLKQQVGGEGQAGNGGAPHQHLVGEAHAVQLHQGDLCGWKPHSGCFVRYLPPLQLLFTASQPSEAKTSVCLAPASPMALVLGAQKCRCYGLKTCVAQWPDTEKSDFKVS